MTKVYEHAYASARSIRTSHVGLFGGDEVYPEPMETTARMEVHGIHPNPFGIVGDLFPLRPAIRLTTSAR
jgi:hypothetical protein